MLKLVDGLGLVFRKLILGYVAPTPPTTGILAESGEFLITESGSYLIQET